METLAEEQFQATIDAIRKNGSEPIRLLNGYLKTDRSSKKLLSSANLKSIRLSKNVRKFTADEPCYISVIDVYASDPTLIANRVNIVATKFDGQKFRVEPAIVNVKNQDGSITQIARYSLGYFCAELEAASESVLKSVAASQFRVRGFTVGQLANAARLVTANTELVAKIDEHAEAKRAEADAAEEKRAASEALKSEIEETISGLEEARDGIQEELDALTTQAAAATQKFDSLKKDLSEYRQKLSSASNNEIQLKESADLLNKEIVSRRQELREVMNDRSLISDEYRDYVLEGKRQSRVYEWFLYFAIAVIAFCAWQLYVGAQRILSVDVQHYTQVWALVLQRVPFAAALSLVVAAAWALAQMFVSRIMAIHAQRLALTRLLVIAKDTVYSSVSDLEISDEQRFRERIRLKLQMLKSHLTSDLGRDFDYKPEAELVASEPVGTRPYEAEGESVDGERAS